MSQAIDVQLQPPYGFIAQGLRDRTVIPFLGSGASLGQRPPDACWKAGTSGFLPSATELASHLADLATFPSEGASERTDLAKVASYFQESIDRPGLVNSLQQALSSAATPGRIQRFLARFPGPLLIVTTNYDALVEEAFREIGRPYHLVVHPTEMHEAAASVLWWQPGSTKPEVHHPSTLPLSLTDTTIIYKMHGTVHSEEEWNSFVISEEDYVTFLAKMSAQAAVPARIMLQFRTGRFLFLGYSLRDWNLRVMLKTIRRPAAETSETRRSWAIQLRPSELEQVLWRSRGVNIYDLALDAFVTKLETLLPGQD